nr:hypothetical protein [Tanacetum cinerariifolium]
MDDPHITMEEYIRLEEEKAQKRRKLFNSKTAKYGKIWYDEDVLDLRSVETEFPVIVFNDNLTSNEIPSCEPTVISLNDETDFRISIDKSDDEDYIVVFDKNSFFYKIISTNDLKTDSENENEKVNNPLFPSPKPTVSCIDDLDFFKDFENKFLAIVYNDALTSKSNFSPEPTLCPQHIDEFDFKDETSSSKYDEEEQNVLGQDMALPPRDQRHQYLRYEGLQNTNTDIADFETRDAQGQSVFTSRSWRWLFDIRGLLVYELILEFFSTFRFGKAVLDLDTLGALKFQLGGVRRRMSWREFILALGLHLTEEMKTAGDFLGTPPSYTLIKNSMLRLCHRLIACSIAGRSQAPKKVTVTDLFYLRGKDVGSFNVPYVLARPARQEGDAGGVTKEVPVAPGGGDEDEEMPQAMSPLPRTQGKMISKLEEEVHGMREALWGQREVLDNMARDFSRFTTWTVTSLARLMDRA